MSLNPICRAASIAACVALVACVGDAPSQAPTPKIKAELKSDNGKDGISFREVLNIAKNRAEMSCPELNLGSLKAYGLKSVANSKLVEADDTTRLLAESVGGSAYEAIEKELKCHCDRGAPMPGYEIFERRQYLQENRRNRRINQTYASFYPKDDTGQLRFLKPGEEIDRAVLEQLPPAAKTERYDNCGAQCKAARKRTNAKAVAEGKPEPFPNLQYPRKQACTK